jgi:transposase
MPLSESILNLPGYDITEIRGENPVYIKARYAGQVRCPSCQSPNARHKDTFIRKLHHESIGNRRCELHLQAKKFQCLDCGRYYHQRFPGILPYRRSTEGFRRQIFETHRDGICQKRLAEQARIGSATVERIYHQMLQLQVSELKSAPCPRTLGIDEHFFTRKEGFATTLCSLQRHRVFDVVLGRSEKALNGYFERLSGKERVRVVCMDLSSSYRSLIKKHLPQALIVADRFHVIRLINQHFLNTWKALDPIGSRNRGLVSLMRRHEENLSPEQRPRLRAYLKQQPALALVYDFKQRLCRLLSIKHRTKKQCRRLIPIFLAYVHQLRGSAFESLSTLGHTLESWQQEIGRMWRFTLNNGITEGFHTKMEMISRRAYGFKNFENYRLRVRALCS